jgi:drug/metabolite transporter (DMT)-like permease
VGVKAWIERWPAERIGVVLAVLAALGFSLKAIFVKLAYAWPVDAVTLLALRMGFALPVFMWVGWREHLRHRHAVRLTGGDWRQLILLGLLGYYGASILDFYGLRYISAGLERLILFTYPTLTLLLGLLFQGRPIRGREIGALALCYGGLSLAFVHDIRSSDDALEIWIGTGFVLASSLSYALYLAGSGPMIARLGAARFTALAMLVSCAGTLAHFLLSQPFSALIQPAPVYALGAAMAIFSTVLPVFMQSAAIRRLDAPRAAMIGTVGPILTIALGAWLLGETISTWQLAGAALVIAGVMQVSRK